MAIPSIQFKKMLLSNNQMDRFIILSRLENWLHTQLAVDPKASNLINWFSNLSSLNQMPDADFKKHSILLMASSFDNCTTFQRIVKSKLAVPVDKVMPTSVEDKPSAKKRQTIPKKIRGQVWENYFGSSTNGKCYCCAKDLKCLDDWHAGHIIASCNGGLDTAENLRPLCGSCNLSMGSESMDAFKQRCYPSPPPLLQSNARSLQIIVNGKIINILEETH